MKTRSDDGYLLIGNIDNELDSNQLLAIQRESMCIPPTRVRIKRGFVSFINSKDIRHIQTKFGLKHKKITYIGSNTLINKWIDVLSPSIYDLSIMIPIFKTPVHTNILFKNPKNTHKSQVIIFTECTDLVQRADIIDSCLENTENTCYFIIASGLRSTCKIYRDCLIARKVPSHLISLHPCKAIDVKELKEILYISRTVYTPDDIFIATPSSNIVSVSSIVKQIQTEKIRYITN
jgi:hypothetical protein